MIRNLFTCHIFVPCDGPYRTDEDMAGKNWLDVHYGHGQFCLIENLSGDLERSEENFRSCHDYLMMIGIEFEGTDVSMLHLYCASDGWIRPEVRRLDPAKDFGLHS